MDKNSAVFIMAANFLATSALAGTMGRYHSATCTQTAFTYTVGAGVQKTVNEHWQVGVGYEFADWGKGHLGRASEQALNGGLALNHLYINGVLLNLIYLT